MGYHKGQGGFGIRPASQRAPAQETGLDSSGRAPRVLGWTRGLWPRPGLARQRRAGKTHPDIIVAVLGMVPVAIGAAGVVMVVDPRATPR